MPEQNTGDGTKTVEDPNKDTGTANSPAEGTQTSSKTTEQQTQETTQQVPPVKKEPEVKKSEPVSVQERINRMYARVQSERSKHAKTKAELDALKTGGKPAGTDDGDGDTTDDRPKGVTEDDVEDILSRRESKGRFRSAETNVLTRHPTALNEDGTFNLDDPFCKEYIRIGKDNPQLAYMENGPLFAEAETIRNLGLEYKKGRTDESKHLTKSENAQTGVSTTSAPAPIVGELTDKERKIARNMRMTDKEYMAQKARGSGIIRSNV